jgi:mono/diheme cytochrome c family protein
MLAMVTSRAWLKSVVVLGLVSGLAQAAGSTVDVAGKSVDLTKLKAVEVTRPDLQVGGQRHYRGVPLSSVVDSLKPGKQADTVLLKFANGMQVPLPRDAKLWKELEPFIALEVERDGAWSADFPEVAKAGAEERDVRPLVFNGNKFVVSTAAHPAVAPAARENGFTPFAYVDTLVGVELVNAAEREQAIKVTRDAAAQSGFKVFLSHCQFCHGVRQVGARYGRDFATPSLAEKDAKALLLHVRYRDADAAEKGQMMPYFKDVGADDVKALLTWIRAVEK